MVDILAKVQMQQAGHINMKKQQTVRSSRAFVAGFLVFIVLFAPFGLQDRGGMLRAQAEEPLTLSAPSATCAASLPEVKLSWAPLSGATSYMIQRRLSPNLSWSGPALDSGLSGTTYTDNRWASSYGVMTYYYQVAALRSDGSRVYSNEVAIAVPNCKSGAPAPAPTPTPTPAPTPTNTF